MKPHQYSSIMIGIALAITACAPEGEPEQTELAGDLVAEGAFGSSGPAWTYAEFDEDGNPAAIGVTFAKAFLDGLPDEIDPTNRCFDLDEDGSFDPSTECLGEWEVSLALPSELSARADNPFKWVGFGWNPFGHEPPGIYDIPHFDAHFYTVSREEVRAIRPGRCGYDPNSERVALFINCEDSVTATMPVPERYAPPDYINVGAAVPDMGNHLLLATSPELGDPPERFTHTFIHGSNAGHITFFEPMFTHEFLMTEPDVCAPVNQPQAWEVAGFYPTEYCFRYLEDEERYKVSIEGFVYREAS